MVAEPVTRGRRPGIGHEEGGDRHRFFAFIGLTAPTFRPCSSRYFPDLLDVVLDDVAEPEHAMLGKGEPVWAVTHWIQGSSSSYSRSELVSAMPCSAIRRPRTGSSPRST